MGVGAGGNTPRVRSPGFGLAVGASTRVGPGHRRRRARWPGGGSRQEAGGGRAGGEERGPYRAPCPGCARTWCGPLQQLPAPPPGLTSAQPSSFPPPREKDAIAPPLCPLGAEPRTWAARAGPQVWVLRGNPAVPSRVLSTRRGTRAPLPEVTLPKPVLK